MGYRYSDVSYPGWVTVNPSKSPLPHGISGGIRRWCLVKLHEESTLKGLPLWLGSTWAPTTSDFLVGLDTVIEKKGWENMGINRGILVWFRWCSLFISGGFLGSSRYSGWWFEIYIYTYVFMFTPIWGRCTHFDSYFSDGLKPPTSFDSFICLGFFLEWIQAMVHFFKIYHEIDHQKIIIVTISEKWPVGTADGSEIWSTHQLKVVGSWNPIIYMVLPPSKRWLSLGFLSHQQYVGPGSRYATVF